MTRDALEPLSAEAQRLLSAEREIPSMPAELRARVMARAETALSGTSTGPVRPLRRLRPLLLAAAFMTAAVGFAAWRVWGDDEGDRAPVSQHPAGPTRPAPAAPLPVPAEPRVESVEAEERAVAKEARATSPAPRRSADVDALELGLLQRARAAVSRREFAEALDALQEHQRRFPSGRLREEREALRVKALAGLGRQDEARRAAERFRERYPGSVLSPRLEDTIERTP